MREGTGKHSAQFLFVCVSVAVESRVDIAHVPPEGGSRCGAQINLILGQM